MGEKEHLPNRRVTLPFKKRYNGKTIFISTGYYPDGRIGELYVNYGRPGTALNEAFNLVAMLASLALQHGASVDDVQSLFADFDKTEIPQIISETLKEANDPTIKQEIIFPKVIPGPNFEEHPSATALADQNQVKSTGKVAHKGISKLPAECRTRTELVEKE